MHLMRFTHIMKLRGTTIHQDLKDHKALSECPSSNNIKLRTVKSTSLKYLKILHKYRRGATHEK